MAHRQALQERDPGASCHFLSMAVRIGPAVLMAVERHPARKKIADDCFARFRNELLQGLGWEWRTREVIGAVRMYQLDALI